MGRRTLLLIASILVAALGTALIWLYVQGADTRAQQTTALVPVLFLNQDAQAGADAATLLVQPREVPATSVPGAVTSQQELAGLRLAIPARAGQVLLRNMLSKTSDQAARFPSGGAVAITISDPNRVPADLQPGDVVDVYSLGARGGSPSLVVGRIRVRSVGPAKQAGVGGAGATAAAGAVATSIIGFDANRDQAEKLYGMVAAGEQPALYDVGTGPDGNG